MKKIISVLLCTVMLLSLIPMLPQTVSAESLRNFDVRLNEPIASHTPDFTAEFNTDAYLYSSVTWQENSPGFSAKLNSSDEFKAGLAYKVTIWIMLSDDYHFATAANGDLDTAITVNGQAISFLKIEDRNSQNQITEVTITCEYEPLGGMTVSNVMITGIPTPVEGQMPIYSFSLGSTNAYSFYHTEPVVWWDQTTGKQMGSGDTFIKGHKYQVNIWLSANRYKGFTYRLDGSGNPDVNVTLNSWAADSVTTAYEQDPREVIDIRYTFPACQAAHTCAPKLVPQQDPTCLMPGFKAYYACSCGKNFEDAAGKKEITDMDGYGIIAALGHKEGSWSYNGTHHYKKCTTCQEVIPGTNAPHAGGTASCIQKATCSTCGQSYGQLDSDHRWGPKYDYKTAAGHAWVCADCKTHSSIEAHTPGAAATATTPQKCTVCDYIITPAKSHTHSLTKVAQVPATCMNEGIKEHYACSGCSKLFADAAGKKEVSETELAIGALGHTASNDWTWDETYHWRICTVCTQLLEETKMVHEAEPCSCGYIAGQETTQKATEETTEEATEENTEPKPTQPEEPAPAEPGGMNWLVIVLVALLCCGIGVLATVLILKKKGNK